MSQNFFHFSILSGSKLASKLAFATLLTTVVACGSNTSSNGVAKASLEDLPKWAINPPKSCDVGSTTFRGDMNLARNTATTRGRDALAKQIETKIQGLMKDYQSQGESGGQSFNEEIVTQVSKQAANTSLVGTRATEVFLTEDDPQVYYTLVCIDPESVAGAMDQMKQLNEKQKEYLKFNAKKAFEELDAEMDKMDEKK
jgi:hypothetical protein